MADPDAVTSDLVDEYFERLAVEGAPRAFWGLTAPAVDPQGDVRWSELSLPVLVVWGAEDRLIRVDEARSETDHLPCSRFVVIDEVGHLPMEEAPTRLAREMRPFLEGVERPACG